MSEGLRSRTWYGPAASNPAARVAPIAVRSPWTVQPVANPGRAIRFQPAHSLKRVVWEMTPRRGTESEAVPLSQKPRPRGNENPVASVGRTDAHPNPAAQPS